MSQIKIVNLQKSFGDFTAVKNSNLTINDKEFFVLLGPSGCGKTTTLRMIAGLELPTSGEIYLGDEEVGMLRASERDIAFVFQLFALYPHMNVRNNLSFPLKMQGYKKGDIKSRVEEAAKLLRIDHILNSNISSLSGGDRQRVALGRALVRRPKAFLMDEPLGTLDAEFRELMCLELKKLHLEIGATTVYVTHDQLEAMSLADRIAVMDGGEILQADEPNIIYNKPKTKFVASFIGSPGMNFFEVNEGISKDQYENCSEASVTFLICSMGIHNIPVPSATITSPFLTLTPAQIIGSLIDKTLILVFPGVGTMCLENAGNANSIISSLSRIPPSTTNPPIPFNLAA